MAGLRYIALRELPVGVDGATVILKPGDEIPNPEEWGRSLHTNLDAGKIAAVPADSVGRGSAADLSDSALLAEVLQRGLPLLDVAGEEGLLAYMEQHVDAGVVLGRFSSERLLEELRGRGVLPDVEAVLSPEELAAKQAEAEGGEPSAPDGAAAAVPPKPKPAARRAARKPAAKKSASKKG